MSNTPPKEPPRFPSCRPPVSRYRFRDIRKWRTRWDQYRDARVMSECLYQGWLHGSKAKPKHVFRAFYGVEGRYLVGVL